MAPTDEQTKATIRSLLREREGYETRGLKDRAKDVDAQLQKLGHSAKPSAKRAQKAKPKQGTEL